MRAARHVFERLVLRALNPPPSMHITTFPQILRYRCRKFYGCSAVNCLGYQIEKCNKKDLSQQEVH